MPNNEYIIECPYCFGEQRDGTIRKFKHDEVQFRSNTVFNGMNDLVKAVTGGEFKNMDDLDFADEQKKKKYQEEINRCEVFTKKAKSEKFKQFWSSFSNSDSPESRNNSETGMNEIDYDYNRPIISVNDKVVAKKCYNPQDGFLEYIQDIRGNMSHARVCPYCNNPLPMNYGRYPVYHIAVVGIKGSGKTVFLSQFLKYLVEECNRIGIATGVPDQTITKYINENKIKENEPLPGSTLPTHLVAPLSINLTIKKKTYTFVFHDIAGESCQDAANWANFSKFIKHSDALILLVDPKQINAFGIDWEGEEPVSLSSVSDQLKTTYGQAVEDIPAACVISQIDRPNCKRKMSDTCPKLYQPRLTPVCSDPLTAMENPKFNGAEYNEIFRSLDSLFIKEPSIVNLKNNFKQINYFGISAIGTDVENNAPSGRPVPYRIAEPFFWILYKLGLIGSNATVCERITNEEFKTRVREEAARCDIEMDVTDHWYSKAVNTEFGSIKKKDKTNFNNIVETLKGQYIVIGRDLSNQ